MDGKLSHVAIDLQGRVGIYLDELYLLFCTCPNFRQTRRHAEPLVKIDNRQGKYRVLAKDLRLDRDAEGRLRLRMRCHNCNELSDVRAAFSLPDGLSPVPDYPDRPLVPPYRGAFPHGNTLAWLLWKLCREDPAINASPPSFKVVTPHTLIFQSDELAFWKTQGEDIK